MLNSGKKVDEISKTFGIGRNVFGRRSVYLEKQIPNEDKNEDLRRANDLQFESGCRPANFRERTTQKRERSIAV